MLVASIFSLIFSIFNSSFSIFPFETASLSPRNLFNSYFEISSLDCSNICLLKKTVSFNFIEGTFKSKSVLIFANFLLINNISLFSTKLVCNFGVN